MTDKEYEEIAPGLIKIQQLFNDQDIPSDSGADKKKMLADSILHLAELMDIALEIPSGDLGDDVDAIMEHVSTYSGVRIQKINLEQKWWEDDLGIILTFMDDMPCVLIPKKYGGYARSTPAGTRSLTQEQLSHVSHFGYVFTKPLPDKIHHLWDIVKFAFSPLLPQLRSIFFLQICSSLILMTLPFLMGYFFNHLNQFNEFIQSHQVFMLSSILIINSMIYFLLSIFQSIMILHLRFKVQARLEPAVWDRLLKLTPEFFRQYNAGNIAYRTSVVSTIQDMLAQSTILSLFGIITALVSLGVMCYYDFKLAMLAVVGFLVMMPSIIFISHRLLARQRKVFDSLAKQSGFVFQVIGCIMKFKVSASEFRAFNIWSDYFSNLLSARYKAERMQIFLNLIHGSLLIIMTFILFFIYVYFDTQLKIGSFVAFNAAFSQFFSALIAMTAFISTFTIIIPLFDQSSVIYQAKEEPLQHTGSHVLLEGKIEIRNMSFHYGESQGLVFKKINLSVKRGEVIGITGSSGCGKTTLFRILLGLEKPLDGQIFYDDINMDMLNLTHLRQQVGVVTQKSVLIPGTIFENIVGNDKTLTRKDAWDIAYKLGIEKMIAAFPMEMETIIHEGMQSLSPGEVQRIVLARALIKNPKILFLDEATSALDSQNQEKINEYLMQLPITQIIIAHRLSTLKHANRILIIHNGDIAQEGSFDQLIQSKGYFSELARLQFSRSHNDITK